jgi:hypothetical protein
MTVLAFEPIDAGQWRPEDQLLFWRFFGQSAEVTDQVGGQHLAMPVAHVGDQILQMMLPGERGDGSEDFAHAFAVITIEVTSRNYTAACRSSSV